MAQLKIGFFFSLTLVFMVGPTWARQDLSDPLRAAQALLAAEKYNEAFTEYRRIEKKSGNHLAQFTLGLFSQMGWGRPVDAAEACRWFEKASEGGVPAAQHFFAECLEKGTHKPEDSTQAALWYQEAADQGHHRSLCSLAKLYMMGEGVPKDPKKGLLLCRQSAEQGATDSQLQMGLFQLNGDDVIRNETEALRWFQIVAQKNNPVAQYYLGVMARDGLVEKQSSGIARQWFESSASQGYGPAYFQTGKLYFNAPVDSETKKLSPQDLAKAYLWLSATAKQSQVKEELQRTKEMLKKIEEIVPETWLPDLDAKVRKHLKEHPSPKNLLEN